MALSFNSSTVSVGDTTKKKQYTRLRDNTVIAVPGDSGMPAKTFYSSATFLSEFMVTTVSSRTATSGVAIAAGKIAQSATASVATFKYKVIDIGPKSFDVGGAYGQEIYVHWSKWREVQVLIYPDPGFGYDVIDLEVAVPDYPGGPWDHALTGFWLNDASMENTEIAALGRGGGDGIYRATGYFTSTSFNRGKITIKYEE